MEKMSLQEMYLYLNSEINNPLATCGILGNLKAESNLNPKNLQNSCEKRLGYNDESYTNAVDECKYNNFIKDSAGYGLAQWTFWTRKRQLLLLAKTLKVSIGDPQLQLNFLLDEIKNNYALWIKLKNSKTIKEASDLILTEYEKPKNQSDSVKKYREKLSTDIYNELNPENLKFYVDEISRRYPPCSQEYTSIVDALKSISVDSSLSNRKKIALANGIDNYRGLKQQNIMMLDLLKKGQLEKPEI